MFGSKNQCSLLSCSAELQALSELHQAVAASPCHCNRHIGYDVPCSVMCVPCLTIIEAPPHLRPLLNHVLLLPAVLAGGQGGFLEAVDGRGGGRATGGACPRQHSSGSPGQSAWSCLQQQQQEQEQQLSEPWKGTRPPSQAQQAWLDAAGTANCYFTSVPLAHSV